MIFKLQQNMSDQRALDKKINTVAESSGSLKMKTSVENPVFILKADPNIISEVNYIEVPELSRKYFITDVTSINSTTWQVSCHVDVLSTYADCIRTQTAIIRRQENIYNLYLDDPVFKTYQNPRIITKEFPSGFDTQNFVLAIAGN